MAVRRRPAAPDPTGPGGMPNELMAGPCIEEWADDPNHDYAPQNARRNWRDAVTAWATENGVPALEAIDAARTRTPWSREFLYADGRREQADRYDGLEPRP